MREGFAGKVSLDSGDGGGWGDHVHTPWKREGGFAAAGFHGVDAKALVPRITVAEWDGAGFPAAAVIAAGEGAEGVEELMVRVGFPMARLASARDDDAGAVLRTI